VTSGINHGKSGNYQMKNIQGHPWINLTHHQNKRLCLTLQGSYLKHSIIFHDFFQNFFDIFLIICNSVKYIPQSVNFLPIMMIHNKDQIIITFHNSTQNSITFQACKAKKQNAMTFQVF